MGDGNSTELLLVALLLLSLLLLLFVICVHGVCVTWSPAELARTSW
jgi:hypothetical protein